MSKKIVFALALLIAPLLYGQTDREILLTSRGTLYTVEREWSKDHPDVAAVADSYLVLTTRNADVTTRRVIPASTLPGVHTNPALAYDNDSDTLFIFWQHQPNGMESELMTTSLDHYGNWSRAATFGASKFRRENFQVAITHRAETKGEDGAATLVNDLNVHAVWWENGGSATEFAGYAMLTIENGRVVASDVRELNSFSTDEASTPADPETNLDIFRHPAIFESATKDSVDIVYGNPAGNSFHQLRLKPVLDGRLRVPTGVKNHGVGGPNFRESTNGARVGTIAGDKNSFVLYYPAKNAMNYLLLKDDNWSPLRSIPLDDKLTSDMAISVIKQMVIETE